MKEESERGGLKLNIKNYDHGMWTHCFMANRGEKMEVVTDFLFLGSKITAVGAAMKSEDVCFLAGKL